MSSRRGTTQTVSPFMSKHLFKFILAGVSIALIFGAIVAGVQYSGDMTMIGGSAWGFDYEFSRLRIQGHSRALPGGTAPGITKTYTAGQDPYHWSYDIDGDYVDSTSAERKGHFPCISVGFSMVGRVDKDGNALTSKQVDPNQYSYNISGKTYFNFYYQFDYTLETSQKQNLGGMEWGYQDVYATITIILGQDEFDTVTDAYFGDARVSNVSWVPDPLAPHDLGVPWAYAPKLDLHHDPGQAIAITSTGNETGVYYGDITLHTGLEPGVTIIGLDRYGSWDIKVVYTLRICLLLIEPLDVGDASTVEPFNYEPPVPWWERMYDDIAAWLAIWGPLLLIAVIIIVVVVVCVRGGINIQRVGH